jgi:hypothetical protein
MKKFWNLLLVVNLLTILYLVTPFFLFFLNPEKHENIMDEFFRGSLVLYIYYPLAIATLVFWVYCMRNAIRLKKTGSLIALVIFNALFTPVFYLINYRRIHGR